MFIIAEDSATDTIATLYFSDEEKPFDLTLLVKNETLGSFRLFLDNLLYREPNNSELYMLRRSIAIEELIQMEDVIYMGDGKTLMFNTRKERDYLKKRLKAIKKLYGRDCLEYSTTKTYYKSKYGMGFF